MRRLALLGLLLALPFVAVPLVWAATGGSGSTSSVCAEHERVDRASLTEGEPSVPPVRWGAHARTVPADGLEHNLRHGGVAVQYGAGVPKTVVRQLLAWYRRDPLAIVVSPKPELGDRLVLSSWSGSARCGTFDLAAFSDFRETRRFRGPESPPRSELAPTRAVEQLRATPTRIAFVVAAAAGVAVEVRDAQGNVMRRLGHFTVASGQKLILTWDGRDDARRKLASGRYVAVVVTDESSRAFTAPFALG